MTGADMLADIDPWARLFLECIQKDSVSTTRITEILGVTDVTTLLQPLAVLAAERSQVDVLKYCIERGASLDDPIFSRAVVIHGTTSAMLEILWDLDWNNIQTNQTELSNLLYYAWHGESSDMLHWLLEHGRSGDQGPRKSKSRARNHGGKTFYIYTRGRH